MDNIKERVLAFNLATEVGDDELQQVAGGTAKYTYKGTHYYTNKKGVEDREKDDQWD